MDKRQFDFYSVHDKKALDETFPLDDIVDAEIHGDKIYFLTTTGKMLEAQLTPRARDLYWKVKLRNRRRAFGL